MASVDTILITGGSGYVGYATIVKALQSGFAVRAIVRRQSAIDEITKAPSVQPFYASGKLTFVVVADFTKPDALVEHAKGCSYLLHVAHPTASTPGDHAPFTVGSTTAMLRAAEANSTVKRIVWTSSVWGIVPYERTFANHADNIKVASGQASEVPTLTADSVIPTPDSVAADAPGIQRYNYAKALGTRMLKDYVASHPSAFFDIVIIIPGWVLGPSELTPTKKEVFNYVNTNSMFMFLYDRFTIAPGLGLPLEDDAPLMACTVHVDDAAEAHVAAATVDLKNTKLRSYLLCSDGKEGPVFDDAIDVVKTNFPDEYKKMNTKAHFGTVKMKQDASRTEKELLGRAFKSYKEMVYDTIGWYKDLPE